MNPTILPPAMINSRADCSLTTERKKNLNSKLDLERDELHQVVPAQGMLYE